MSSSAEHLPKLLGSSSPPASQCLEYVASCLVSKAASPAQGMLARMPCKYAKRGHHLRRGHRATKSDPPLSAACRRRGAAAWPIPLVSSGRMVPPHQAKGCHMATYVTLLRYTSRVQEHQRESQPVEKEAVDQGAPRELKSFHLVQGRYDAIVISEGRTTRWRRVRAGDRRSRERAHRNDARLHRGGVPQAHPGLP